MANLSKVEGLLRNLATYTGYLQVLAGTDRNTFLQDPEKLGAAKYYLQVAIEVCLDLGNHLIASERCGVHRRIIVTCSACFKKTVC